MKRSICSLLCLYLYRINYVLLREYTHLLNQPIIEQRGFKMKGTSLKQQFKQQKKQIQGRIEKYGGSYSQLEGLESQLAKESEKLENVQLRKMKQKQEKELKDLTKAIQKEEREKREQEREQNRQIEMLQKQIQQQKEINLQIQKGMFSSKGNTSKANQTKQ